MKEWWKDPIFATALAFAAVLHLAFLTMQFTMPQEADYNTKEIAVSLRPTTEKIEHADFLAQADQQGSGTFRESHRMSSDMPAPMIEQKAGEQKSEALEQLQQKKELSFEDKVLMTTLSWQKQAEENC